MGKTGGVTERHDEAFEFDEKLTVVGAQLRPGDAAPAFALPSLDPASEEMRDVALADSAGAVRLLNVVNSLDTPVCHVETHRWEQLRDELPEGVRVYTISMDLPFALAQRGGRRARGAVGARRRRVRRGLRRAAEGVAPAPARGLRHRRRREGGARRVRRRPDGRAGLRRCGCGGGGGVVVEERLRGGRR